VFKLNLRRITLVNGSKIITEDIDDPTHSRHRAYSESPDSDPKSRDLPIPVVGRKYDFSYIARIKAYLQDARDLVKFIPKTPSATPEIKDEVIKIYQEVDKADREILH